MRFVFLFLFLIVGQMGEAMSKLPSRGEVLSPSYAIGVRTLEIRDEARNRPIVIEFWYPANLPLEKGSLVRDAAFLEKGSKVPLLVYSHGHRGSRHSLSWLASLFASHGYCFASVEHYGNTKENFHPLLSLKFWDRSKDISVSLDYLLQQFSFQIDDQKIGFVGYSMGGMTGLGLAGAQAENVKEIALREYRSHKGFSEEAISQIDFSEGEKIYTDRRIKAMLLVCPANFVYRPEALKKIQIPIALVANFYDEVLPHQEHAYPIICYVVPRKIKVIREKISHSFFSHHSPDTASDDGRLHKEVGKFAFDFFQSHFSN